MINAARSSEQTESAAVLVEGCRTPFVKSFGKFKDSSSLELLAKATSGVLRKTAVNSSEVDCFRAGAVIPQNSNPNVARDTVLALGLDPKIHGETVSKACISSLQTIADSSNSINCGNTELELSGGVEVLSDVPILYSDEARDFLLALSKSRTLKDKITTLQSFSAKAFIPKPPSIAEPLTGLSMGQHAEIMAKRYNISRKEQDEYALECHKKAHAALAKRQEEIVTTWSSTNYKKPVEDDDMVRENTSLEDLAKIRPAFDKPYGTISAGNSSPLTDGAAVCLIAHEAKAKELGLYVKAKFKKSLFVGVPPAPDLLIGPAMAIPKILKSTGLTVDDIDLFEIHEAFAAQVLCCLKAMKDKKFVSKHLGDGYAPIEIPREKINVNGGALAIGHPFGATGARLVTCMANELIRSKKRYGLIAACAAGGMAGTMLIENPNV